jgi:hypothetical protein
MLPELEPASVVTVALATSMARTRTLETSATKRRPAPSSATPLGNEKKAALPTPSAKPAVVPEALPPPAIVVTTRVPRFTARMVFVKWSPMYAMPPALTAMPRGLANRASVPAPSA